MKKECPITEGGNTQPVFLDITGQVCPLTFVHTRLRLERMGPGEILEIRLAGTEPLENLPRSLADEGHEVLSLEPEDKALGIHRLRVRKAGAPL
ncbi:MAG TPA: sulfurtransferase TusA family protein [Alphaproteobacteria bacterium]|nr:sulfurtransferase TusA family protein [Alphaproteobacteria bacterium]